MTKKSKSTTFNINANILVLISYLGGLLLTWIRNACYFAWAIPLIVYLTEEKNKFIKHQSAQATFLYLLTSLVSIISYLLLILVSPNNYNNIYSLIVGGNFIIIAALSIIISAIKIIVTIFTVVAIIKTWNYQEYEIPYLNKLLPKFIKYLEIIDGKKIDKEEPKQTTKENKNKEQKPKIKRNKIHKNTRT